jgi:hypothetical protein
MATGDYSTGGIAYNQAGHRLSPDDKLGYSRHYAERIRDLGRSSKDGWINRIWNHWFGGTPVITPSSEEHWSRHQNVEQTDRPSYSQELVTTPVAYSSSEKARIIKNGMSYDVLSTQVVNSPREKEPRLIKTAESNDITEDQKLENPQKPTVVEKPTSVRTPKQQSSFVMDRFTKDLPVRLINTPYLPAKDRIVYYRPVVTPKLSDDNRDGIVAAKLRYQKLSSSKKSKSNLSSISVPNIKISTEYASEGQRSAQSQQVHNNRDGIKTIERSAQSQQVHNNHDAAKNIEKSAQQVHNNPDTVKTIERSAQLQQVHNNPDGIKTIERSAQSPQVHNNPDEVKTNDTARGKAARDMAAIQLEKKAKVIADRAIKVSRISVF